jgi:fibronectin-binding autotransporter adhesin
VPIGTPVAISGDTAAATAGSVSATIPGAGWSAGDVAYINVGCNFSNATPTVTGWTQVGTTQTIPTGANNEFISLWKRTMQAGDTTVTATWASLTGRASIDGAIVPGADPSALDLTPVNFNGAADTGSSLTIPAFTPVTADDLALIVMMRRTAAGSTTTVTPPTGWIELTDHSSSNGTGTKTGGWAGYRQLSGQAGVSQPSFTFNFASTNNNGFGWLVVLKPTATAGALDLSGSGTLTVTGSLPIDPAKVVVIGDSLTSQSGNGATAIPTAMQAVGWASGNIYVDGLSSRQIINGGPAPQTQTAIATMRGTGFEPMHWVVGLGTNHDGGGVTLASIMSLYRQLLALIGPGRIVHFVNTGYQTQSDTAWTYTPGNSLGTRYQGVGNAGVPNAAMYNIAEQGTNALTEPDIFIHDWNGYAPMRAAGSSIWLASDVSAPSGDARHMTTTGYNTYRNPFYAMVSISAGELALTGSGTLSLSGSASTTGVVALSGSGTQTRASGSISTTGALTLTGTGTLTLAGTPAATGALGLTGAGTLTVGGSAVTTSGAVSLAGSGSLALAGSTAGAATINLSGVGNLTLTGSASTSGAVGLSGSGVLTTTGSSTSGGTLTLTGAGVLEFAAQTAQAGTLTLLSSGLLALDGTSAHAGSLALAGSGFLTTSGSSTSEGDGVPVPTPRLTLTTESVALVLTTSSGALRLTTVQPTLQLTETP